MLSVTITCNIINEIFTLESENTWIKSLLVMGINKVNVMKNNNTDYVYTIIT